MLGSGEISYNHNPIIVALDKTDIRETINLVESIKNNIGSLKLGLEFFCANGPEGVLEIQKSNIPIFLDLKLHDIPNTVAKSLSKLLDLKPNMTTLHSLNGSECLKNSVSIKHDKGSDTDLLAVTILTSHNDISEIGIKSSIQDQVLKLAELSLNSGMDGIVCSPHEISLLRKEFGNDFLIVTPGIRAKTDNADDQKRTLSAKEAIELGANHLVIGRPITKSQDPSESAKDIFESLKVT